MAVQTISELLWGSRAKARYLYLVAAVLFFTCLGGKELWTQEHRWADIVSGMFIRHDFLHPYLGNAQYYDKPLLSYWLMAGLSWLMGGVNTLALRIPSALAGLLAVWSVVRMGTFIKDKALGLLAGWLFVTTYFLVFWARVSSADMLNVAGTFFALAWYLDHRDSTRFFDYFVFFITLAFTALCKGLGGAIVPMIGVLVDVCQRRRFSILLAWRLYAALVPALMLYFLPFWASSHFGGHQYGESGLYLVYRENILRYFQPFDHEGPIYTYLIFLPLYLLPWTIFFVPALCALPRRFKHLNERERWLCFTFAAVFLFFTLSGSRRSYYVLPIVPFALLFTAEWLAASTNVRLQKTVAGFIISMSMILWVAVDMVPAWVSQNYGMPYFAKLVEMESAGQAYSIVLLDAESKVNFYLGLSPTVKNVPVIGDRETQTEKTLRARYPFLAHPDKNTIYVSRQLYLEELLPNFAGYRLVLMPESPFQRWSPSNEDDQPIAFVPRTNTMGIDHRE